MLKNITIIIIFCFLTLSYLNAESKKSDTIKLYSMPSITVTTTKAEFGKSPVPFSELTKTDIENIYSVKDLPDLLSELPSISFYSENGNSIGYSNLTMRGFDQRRISVMINGIPQNDPEDHQAYWIDFPDISSNLDNIQVQRGAGLINYGAAAIGGSINLTTSNFANQKGIKIYSGIGYQEYTAGFNTVYQPTISKYSLEMSSGIVGKYAFYARLSKINSEGYRDRSWAYLNSYFVTAARFDNNFTTQINIFGGPISDGLAYSGLPKSFIKDPNLRRKNPSYWSYDSTGSAVDYFADRRAQEVEGFSQPHFEILNNWAINENLTFMSSLFYYTGEGYFDYDGSWADGMLTSLIKNDYPYADSNISNSLIRGYVNNKQGGWIPRIVWNHGSGELTFGAELRIHRSEHWGKLVFSEYLPKGFDPDYKIYSYNGKRNIMSVFAREQYKILPSLTLNLEAQLVNHTIALGDEKFGYRQSQYLTTDNTIAGNGNDIFSIDYLFFNPRLGLVYNLNDKLSIYTLLAYTSSEPRMRNFYAADDTYFGATPLFEGDTLGPKGKQRYDFSKPLVKPERMLDYELGSTYHSELINLSANFYWMEYFDELVKSGRLDIFGNPIDGNAPRSRHYGFELSGKAQLFNNHGSKLWLSANATVSKNLIVDYSFNTSGTDKISLNGNSIAGFPDFMANVRLGYEVKGLYVSTLFKYLGSYYTDNFGGMIANNQQLISFLRSQYSYYNDNKSDPYFVCNFDVSYTFKDFLSLQSLKVSAQINNLFNKLYSAGAEGKDFFPAAERNFFFGLELGL